MIRSEDFEIEIGHDDRGLFIRIKHKPTGNQRFQQSVPENDIGRLRESMISELRGQLFGPKDFVFDTGRSVGGDFICVRHLPTGIERSAMRCESTHEHLLDAVLEEVYSGKLRGHDPNRTCG